MLTSREVPLFWLFLASIPAQAAPPTLANLTPRGAERGKTIELTIAGANLTPKTRLLTPFKATQENVAEMKPNPAQVKVRLTLDPTTPLGSYPVRVATEEGISAPLLFVVDSLPTVAEVEDNNTVERAQKVQPPIVIDGQCAGGDVDHFRIGAKKGQRLVLEVESARLGSAVQPMLRVTDERQRLLASDDRQSLRGDARIVFLAPADGDYLVELADTRYRGGTPPFYRFKLADYDVIDEVFPLGGRRGSTGEFTLRGGSLSNDVRITRSLLDGPSRGQMPLLLDGVLRPGRPVSFLAVGDLPERLWLKNTGRDPRALDLLPPVTVNSRLERAGDVDRFQFPAEPGQRYRIAVQAEAFGSRLDGVLRVTDQSGRQLALADDSNVPPAAPGLQGSLSADPSVDLTVPPGATLIIVELRDQRNRGGLNFVYRLSVEPAAVDFTLQSTVTELNVPRGGTALLPIAATRRGYAGPIQMRLRGLPAGWSGAGGEVGAASTAGVFTVTAPAGAMLPNEPITVSIDGRATEPGVALQRVAEVHAVLNRESSGPGALWPLAGVALGITSAEPITLAGPPGAEAVIGYPTTVPIRLARAKEGAMVAVQLSARDAQTAAGQPAPPERLTAPAPPASAGDAATLTITPGVNLPSGVLDLIVEGKARVANVDRTIQAPIVPITIRRPFDVTPPSALALVPGTTTTIRLPLKRQPVFKEVVQVRLDGLPAGVALAKPLTPAMANANEIVMELKADAKAVAAMANATLTCTATVGGRAYAHPPVTIPIAIK